MAHKEVQSKILKAPLLLDKILAIELEQELKKGNFYLNNAYVIQFSNSMNQSLMSLSKGKFCTETGGAHKYVKYGF